MSRKKRYLKAADQLDSGEILVIEDRPGTGGPKKRLKLISGGNIVDSATFPTTLWRADIPAARAKEHGFAHIEIRASGEDMDAISGYFQAFGIEVRTRPLSRPSSTSVPAIQNVRKLKTIANFDGRVDSFDDDGYATTVLEDDHGDLTRVRFSIDILKEQGILPDTRFTYSLYKTPHGGGYRLKRRQTEVIPQSEWEDIAKRAREIGDLFEATEPYAAEE